MGAMLLFTECRMPDRSFPRHTALNIAPDEFARRAQPAHENGGGTMLWVLIATAPERMRNADAPWPYRQDSDFHYLSGFPRT